MARIHVCFYRTFNALVRFDTALKFKLYISFWFSFEPDILFDMAMNPLIFFMLLKALMCMLFIGLCTSVSLRPSVLYDIALNPSVFWNMTLNLHIPFDMTMNRHESFDIVLNTYDLLLRLWNQCQLWTLMSLLIRL